jgi:hypothetical protein
MYIDSDGGRVGSFWWVNAVTSKIELHSAAYNGSLHYVWRPGSAGFGDPSNHQFFWKIIES